MIHALVLFLAAAAVTTQGWLGLGVTYHTTVDAHGAVNGWLFIRKVDPEGPGAHAGLHVQDVITAIDGKALHYRTDLEVLKVLAAVKAGQHLRLTVTHQQTTSVVEVVAAPVPERARGAWRDNFDLAKQKSP